MDAAAALSGCEGPAWARLGSLLLLLCGRGAEAVRELDDKSLRWRGKQPKRSKAK